MPPNSVKNGRQHLSGKPSIVALANAAGIPSAKEFAVKLGVGVPFVGQLLHGKTPRNHPYLPKVADVLNVPLAQLASLMLQRDMGEQHVKRVTLWVEKGKPNTPRGKRVKKRASNALVLSNCGNKRVYNRVKGGALDLRQNVRSLAMTVNLAVMRGDLLLPALPVQTVAVVLADYLQEKGIKGALLDPGFAALFD